MTRPKSDNLLWLAIMSVVALVAIIQFPLGISLVALAGWVIAGLLTFTDIQPGRWLDSIRSSASIRKGQVGNSRTPAARQASARAKARGNLIPNDLLLLDIGLIASRQSTNGPIFQRTDSLNSDHNAVRPYIRLRLPSDFTERHALLRFSFEGPDGNEVYIHELETWLTAGEQDLIPTHQMPITDSRVIENLGDWKLEVALDGRLIAEHGFRISPSIERRRNRLREEASTSPDSIPLDDLLIDD